MHFHRAADDGARVRAFYDDLTDAMADAPYPPGWRKGVYPTQAFLDASIAHGELFLAELDGVLAGCMVLNHAYNDGYAAATWAATSRPSGSTPGRALPAAARCGCFMPTPAGRTTASMNICCERTEKTGCGIPQPVFTCWCAQYALIGSESSSCPFSTERMMMS